MERRQWLKRGRRSFGTQAVTLIAAACAVSKTAGAAAPSAGDNETSRSLYAQGVQALDAHGYAAAERACVAAGGGP
jgi:hypothetical protein